MNIKKYYLHQFFSELMPIYPLYALLFDSKNFSVSQISMLLAIWSIPAVILEIPTGIFGDRFSRKNLIFLSGILKAAGYFVWIFSGSFFQYAIGFALWGISISLRSGAEEALLYDSLKFQGIEEQFDRVYGKGRFISGVSTIIASLAGGFIGKEWGFPAALYLSVIFGLISAGIAKSMKEINFYKEDLDQQEDKGDVNTLRDALAFLFGNKEIFLFTLMTLLVLTTAGVLDEYDQLVAKEFGLSISLIGAWTAFRFLLSAFGGFIAHGLGKIIEKLFKVKSKIYTISILCVIGASFLIVSGVVRELGVMLLYGMFYFILSATDVLREDYVQQKIELEGRSTVHSIISLAENLYAIVCFGLFGFVVSKSNLFTGLAWCGVYILFWIVSLSIIFKLLRKKH